jgi:hypothetical protein
MIENVAIYAANGQKLTEIVVGAGGVKKAFFDKEEPGTLVVTMEDSIVTYHGFFYVVQKAYSVKQ